MFSFLRERFPDVSVIQEDAVSQITLLRRRVRRLGVRTVVGQVLFRLVAVPWLTARGRRRVVEIMREAALEDCPMRDVRRVQSMNDEDTRSVLRALHPAITVVCGTRILDRATLAALNGPVVNFHAGITPLYRGVHGGYWALVEGRGDLVGSTIHRIDPGIDTGEVLAQVGFQIDRNDNFATYPYLHVAAVLPALETVVRRALVGEDLGPDVGRTDIGSKLRTHPTLFEYLKHARAGVH